jgi:RND family efflux transporter MFP subunit
VPTPTAPIPDSNGQLTYAITHRLVSEGSYVRVGGEVCRAAIDRPLKLRVHVPELHSEEVKVGQKAEVAAAASGPPILGTVARINPSVDTTNRTFEVEIHLSNADGKLKPGGFARASIHTRLEEKAATVPLEAIVQFAGITKVFLADGARSKEMHVKLGVQSTDYVEISEPRLPAGAQVITSGQSALAENSPITIRR